MITLLGPRPFEKEDPYDMGMLGQPAPLPKAPVVENKKKLVLPEAEPEPSPHAEPAVASSATPTPRV